MSQNQNQNQNLDRSTVLKQRTEFLNNDPKVFSTQNKTCRSYINMLDLIAPPLTPFQKQALTGLILSDGNVDLKQTFSKSGRRNSRIKTQQTSKNGEFLQHLKSEVFVEFSSNNNPISKVSPNRPKMYEYDTLTSGNFSEVIQLFSNQDLSSKEVTSFKKEINKNIKKEITPVTLAYWFCGDGGKVNYKGDGKGISFATNGFTESDVYFLADCLKEVGLDCRAVVKNKEKNQFEIYLTGPAFDLFIEKVGPYIPKCMAYKLPIGRSEKSQWGYMTEELKQTIIGSHFEKQDWIYSDINWDTY